MLFDYPLVPISSWTYFLIGEIENIPYGTQLLEVTPGSISSFGLNLSAFFGGCGRHSCPGEERRLRWFVRNKIPQWNSLVALWTLLPCALMCILAWRDPTILYFLLHFLQSPSSALVSFALSNPFNMLEVSFVSFPKNRPLKELWLVLITCLKGKKVSRSILISHFLDTLSWTLIWSTSLERRSWLSYLNGFPDNLSCVHVLRMGASSWAVLGLVWLVLSWKWNNLLLVYFLTQMFKQ